MRESANPIDYFIIESDARDNKKSTLGEEEREKGRREWGEQSLRLRHRHSQRFSDDATSELPWGIWDMCICVYKTELWHLYQKSCHPSSPPPSFPFALLNSSSLKRRLLCILASHISHAQTRSLGMSQDFRSPLLRCFSASLLLPFSLFITHTLSSISFPTSC